MSELIVYVDTSEVRAGRFSELEAAMKRLAAFVENNVPRLMFYAFFLNEARNRMTVVAVHPDSDSLEFHMDAGANEFRKFADLIDLASIDVYGRVTEPVVERLQKKAQMLGGGTVTVHELHAGFARLSTFSIARP